MANKIVLKKSSVALKVPTTSDLDYGELAINYADGKLYYKNSVNSIVSFQSDLSSYTTLTGTQTLTNKTLTSPTINGGALSGTFSGAISLSDTTASTSTTTGTLKIGGGLGVVGAIYADQIRLTNNGAGTNVYIGDDVRLGDINQANMLGVYGIQDSTKAYITFGSANSTNYIGRDGTNPLQVTGQFKVDSGTVTGGNAVAMQITGYANKGGTGYHDFLSVTNAYPTATNASKFFRLNNTGNIEIINSAYTANIFTLTDTGSLTIPEKLSHQGLSPTAGTNIDQITTITVPLTLTTDWQDTGINATDLATGTYLIQLYANDSGAGGNNNNEYYSGTMSWYSGSTNSSVTIPTDEIVLHRAGASSDGGLYLRTYRSPSADAAALKLQIYANIANSSSSNYVFKFRRMM